MHFPYDIRGTASRVSESLSMEEWADLGRVDTEVVAITARTALEHAGIAAQDLDALILVTCTPHQFQRDQELFRYLSDLGIPDNVPPLQVSAGCAGVARAAAIAARLLAWNALILSYDLPSCHLTGPEPAICTDSVGALVLCRNESASGVVHYSRDSQSFGAWPASRDCQEGMMLNHRRLSQSRPRYGKEVRRIYTHEGSLATPGTIQLLDDDIQSGLVRDHDEICISVVGADQERGVLLSRVRTGASSQVRSLFPEGWSQTRRSA